MNQHKSSKADTTSPTSSSISNISALVWGLGDWCCHKRLIAICTFLRPVSFLPGSLHLVETLPCYSACTGDDNYSTHPNSWETWIFIAKEHTTPPNGQGTRMSRIFEKPSNRLMSSGAFIHMAITYMTSHWSQQVNIMKDSCNSPGGQRSRCTRNRLCFVSLRSMYNISTSIKTRWLYENTSTIIQVKSQKIYIIQRVATRKLYSKSALSSKGLERFNHRRTTKM